MRSIIKMIGCDVVGDPNSTTTVGKTDEEEAPASTGLGAANVSFSQTPLLSRSTANLSPEVLVIAFRPFVLRKD